MKKVIFLVMISLTTLFCFGQENLEQRAFKGRELFSYLGEQGDISYCLLQGTNRNKTFEEIIANSLDHKQLIEKIKSLAKNETIFWFNKGPSGFFYAYPVLHEAREIEILCKEKGITLEGLKMPHKVILKDWHLSPRVETSSGTVYPFAVWGNIALIEVGIDSESLEKLIYDVQNYHHPVNAIVYTIDPQGIEHEVAIKLSEDKKVQDLSFKEIKITKGDLFR